MIWWFLLFLLFVRGSFSRSHATSCPLRECWNGDRVSSQHSLRLTLRDRPQLSQRDDRLIESLVTVRLTMVKKIKNKKKKKKKRLTNGPFHIPSKNIASLFIQKNKKHLLPIFFTCFDSLWPDLVLLCPKIDFLRKIDTFYKGWHE